MKKSWFACICFGALGFALFSCGGGGPEGEQEAQTFNLVYCDQDSECAGLGDGSFECSPVYCADKCIPDANGKCMSCNKGKKGKCLPKPKTDCKQCDPNSKCSKVCSGYCDPTTEKCEDVVCESKCIPMPIECSSDKECGAGKHCEFICSKCAIGYKSSDDGMAPPKCIDGECKGVCVDNPEQKKKCNKEGDCPDGYTCAPVACPAICIPDGKGGCVPCNDGFYGVCVPASKGCKVDADCKPDEFCQISCIEYCDAFDPGCKSECNGVCVKKVSGCEAIDCGVGYKCEVVCAVCAGSSSAPGADFGAPAEKMPMPPPDCGGCYPTCVPISEPKKCNSDKDCKQGFHCEPVVCPMICKPSPNGGCLPCNDGFMGVCIPNPTEGCKDDSDCGPDEECQIACTGLCSPDGCSNQCFGICVPKTKGCQTDKDCADGYHCEIMCPGACSQPVFAEKSDSTDIPGCYQTECIGQCVKNPVEIKCNSDIDCPSNMYCEFLYCAEKDVCMPDGKGGCLPTYCNDGFAGICMLKPTKGCFSDMDCKPSEFCDVTCVGGCGPNGCFEECKGICVPKPQDCSKGEPCPQGYICQVVCVDCPQGTDCDPGCFGTCVPEKPNQKQCNSDKDCSNGWHCEPVFCTMQCIPAPDGGCIPCNDGFLGICMPNPQQGCTTNSDCKAGEKCKVYCEGYCYKEGYCADTCKGVCVPAAQGCQTDMDCPKGYHCELMCTKGCEDAYGYSGAEPAFAPKCPDSQCYGQCIPNKPEPKKCNSNKDCPESFICEPVYCTMVCIPDGKGGCLPCNDGFLGQCVPKPPIGCKDDQDCGEGQYCDVYCTGLCDASGCKEVCKGVCLPKEAGCDSDKPCPEGQECVMLCYDCAPNSECIGGCFGKCIPKQEPKKCNADKDCPDGFFCQPVYCTLICIDDGKGGCLPCNNGYLGECVPKPIDGCKEDKDCGQDEHCETYCTGFCDPSKGCGQACFGMCIPNANKGCQSDKDCAQGFACEKICPPTCGAQPGSNSSDAMPPPPCVDQECFGQCVPKIKCKSDKECPEGMICAPTMNPTGESFCIPAGIEGCKKDQDCPQGQHCQVDCPMFCSGSGCNMECKGSCVPIKIPI